MASKDRSGVFDYSDLIYRHLDRMSDTLKNGIEVGEIKNASLLMSYYMFVMHLDNLLNIRMGKSYYEKIQQYKKRIPGFEKAYSGQLMDNIAFLEGVSKWFQILLIVANNQDFISISPKTYDDFGDDIVGEDNGPSSSNS